jgi:hypothetical protein
MKNQFKGFYVLSAVLLLIAILLPILVNQCFINLFMKSAPLGNKEWLGFFGSYLGGIIGAFATLIALFATYQQVIELEYGYKDANQQIDTVFFKHSDNQKPDWINKSKSC